MVVIGRIETASEEETVALGARLGELLRAGDVVGLDGELGAGKTRLVRGIATGMGAPREMVHSPTYVLMNEYPTERGCALVHVDAYRLRGADDLESTGWSGEPEVDAVI
ncbi:MAG: tRNA (adenosine(37)-N6)-threonylcarbamoyltransferase complex ATPase subunit type 1 TsaE, partial [Planctomycetota bacterium]|nr:tRNA (adenosine(37)-N6)-threonylcarbamoyltransferase complex ATPase subunit type 1 TsaE [Planctomycetota bacterium]